MRILPSPLADKPWLKLCQILARRLCQILARRLDQTEEKLHHCHEYDIWKTNAYVVSELVNVGFFFFFLQDGIKPKPGKTTNFPAWSSDSLNPLTTDVDIPYKLYKMQMSHIFVSLSCPLLGLSWH